MASSESKKDIALRKYRRMKDDRQSWEPTWKSIAKYCLPYSGRFDGDLPNDGKRKGQDIYDSRAIRCIRNLAAFLFSGMTSPSKPWFRLGVGDADLAEDKGVKAWLEIVEDRILQVLAKSNFYLVQHQLYEELCTFGSACEYIEEDPDTFIRCAIFTVGRYLFAIDDAGRVDTVCRVVPMTARQICQAFDESKVPSKILSAKGNESTSTFDVLHAVYPNENVNPKRVDAASMPYTSIYILLDGETVLRESGYWEMPYMAPRWTVSGEEVYGRSPAYDALGEIIMLQMQRKDRLKAVHKIINPPMVVPAGYPTSSLDTRPGAVNSEPSGAPNTQGIRPLYNVPPNIPTIINEMEDSRRSVESLFFNDLVLMVDENPKMTATEVIERRQEKMLMLGPIVERLQSELLNPVINRVFGLLMRAMLLPDPPEYAGGVEIKVEYISPLAQAQRRTGIDAISGAVAFAMQAAQGDLTALDRLNIGEAVQRYAELGGVPAALIRSDEEVEQLQTRRAQAQAEAQKQQQMAAAIPIMADAMHKAGQIDLDKNTLAGQLMGGNSQQQGGAPPRYATGGVNA